MDSPAVSAANPPPRASTEVPRVGMMYEGWHAPAYWGRAGNLTVEGVVRSNGTHRMAEMHPGASSMNFY